MFKLILCIDNASLEQIERLVCILYNPTFSGNIALRLWCVILWRRVTKLTMTAARFNN